MVDPALARLTPAEIAIINDGVDAELAEIYGADEAEPGDLEFDLLDFDLSPCPDNPGGHVWLGSCGETVCIHCGKVVG
jgi:hypothetical protein